MRGHLRQGLALTAAIGLFAAGCGDGQVPAEDPAASDASIDDGSEDPDLDPDDAGETPDGGGAAQDPNTDVEDGVYRGNGVVLPVPDGWTIEPTAFQQGVVAAIPPDGAQQLTAQAIDTTSAGAAGAGPLDIESLLDGVRQQIDQEPDADEELTLAGADRAQRLTYLQLPGQQEGQPETSATIVLAEADGLVGEFVYSATAEDYDEATASALLDQAGFDPDSEPAELPQQPQPAPDQDDGAPEEPSEDAG